MGESKQGWGDGILKGLKKVLFTATSNETSVVTSPGNPAPVPATQPTFPNPKVAVVGEKDPSFSDNQPQENTTGVKDMKLRIYDLLEQMNKPGVDFFEVWNAAVEMGGANAINLKSAYTSLRFADKSLNKTQLIDSGNGYVKELQALFETESKKRKEEKARIAAEKEQVKTGLTAEIKAIQLQITELQTKLDSQKQKLLSIDETFDPRLLAIEQKIATGSEAVNSVLDEMQQVIQIINKEIN